MGNMPPPLSGPAAGNTREQSRVLRRTWIVWGVILAGIVLLILFRDRMEPADELITQYRFEELVDSNLIIHATIRYDQQSFALNEVVGKYYQLQNGEKKVVLFRTKVRLAGGLERKLLSRPEFEPQESYSILMNVLWSLLPIIIIAVLIWFFFIRQIKIAAKAAPSAAELHAKTVEQQERFDRILNKWEEQARRLDVLLDKREREEERRS